MTYVMCAMERAEYFWKQWRPPGVGTWIENRRLDALTVDWLEDIGANELYFAHWSRIVPPEITDHWRCVNFHSTPLPYGRGSSPIQNMILRGHRETKVTAHLMTSELDGGDILMQRPMSLLGGGQEIYLRLGRTIRGMIHELVKNPDEFLPTPQEGEVVRFPRRKPEQSNLMLDENLERRSQIGPLYDFIRMLDMPHYPHAYIEQNGLRYELTNPVRTLDGIEAHVKIAEVPPDED